MKFRSKESRRSVEPTMPSWSSRMQNRRKTLASYFYWFLRSNINLRRSIQSLIKSSGRCATSSLCWIMLRKLKKRDKLPSLLTMSLKSWRQSVWSSRWHLIMMYHMRIKLRISMNNLTKSCNLSARNLERKLSVVRKLVHHGIHRQFKVVRTLLKRSPAHCLMLLSVIKSIYRDIETK